jgi:hypothetical protein
VGIGTYPTEKLDVRGDINIDTTFGTYKMDGTPVLQVNAWLGNTQVGPHGTTPYTTAHHNTFVGANAGLSTESYYNTFIGSSAGENTTGQNNTFIGFRAGGKNVGGYGNTYLGYEAGYNNEVGSSNVFLGYRAGHNETGSNKLYIGSSHTGDPLVYGEFDNAILSINADVGIGTTSPDQRLHILGNNPRILIEGSSGNPEVNFRNSGDTFSETWAIYKHETSDDLRFYQEGSDRVTIENTTGNVGIGTTDPQGKLDVNGSIYQRGVKLYSDHVFESDYDLESIDEHAEFMWNEKHLKAVPRAKKDEKGQDIVEYGSHIRGIVEELEKAHIYIAKLNNSVKNQKDLIEDQQEAISSLQEKVRSLEKLKNR